MNESFPALKDLGGLDVPMPTKFLEEISFQAPMELVTLRLRRSRDPALLLQGQLSSVFLRSLSHETEHHASDAGKRKLTPLISTMVFHFLRSDDTSKQDIIRMDDILDSSTNCP